LKGVKHDSSTIIIYMQAANQRSPRRVGEFS
jgi:hypothetical protein